MAKIDKLLNKTVRDGEAKKWVVVVGIVVGVLIAGGLFFGLLCPFTYAGYISGELVDIDTVIQYQRDSSTEYLIGMAYSYPDQYLKLNNTQYYKPTLLTLGTSRVMQFKDYEFVCSFYNAGGGISNINQFSNFIRNVNKENLPDVIIIGLDSYFFNDNWNGNLNEIHNVITKPDEVNIKIIFGQMILDFQDNKWNFSLLNSNTIKSNAGFSAIFKNAGFMKDGSYYYGYIYTDPSTSTDYQFRDTFQRIQTGTRRFEYASDIDNTAIDCLREFLSICNENKITVIGFIPPYAPSVIDKMNEYEDKYSYLYKIGPQCDPIFSKYGYEFYDYTDIRRLGCDDSYFIDGFHGSEVAYLAMLIDMINNESILNKYVNITNLEELYQYRHSNMTVRSLELVGVE